MARSSTAYDAVIVGAGPVGMTAAVLLSAGGASVLVLEKNAGTSDAPKAISIDDEALRSYAGGGIADRILSIIVPGTGTRYYDRNGEAVFHAGPETPYRLGFPFKNPFAQPDLERLLLRVLDERDSVTMRFGATLSELESNEHGVTAVYEHEGATHRVPARFLLGADGGRSTVRGLLGIGLTGRSHDENWLVIDALNDTRRERFGMHHGNPARPHVIVPGLGGRCRYEFRVFDDEAGAGDEPTMELLTSVLAPYRSIEPSDLERAVIYRFHGLIADRWQSGSAFLLGDAAHMMPPFAGQGLNSGIRDAANLTWKLLAVLAGTAPSGILDSYQRERYQHARDTILLSERLGRVVMTTSPRIAAARDAALQNALVTAEGRAFFEHMHYRPNARFTEGLVLADTHPRAGTQLGQPRAFDTTARRVRLLDDATGSGWRILGVAEDQPLRNAELDDFARASSIPIFDVPLQEELPDLSDGRTALVDIDSRLTAELAELGDRFVLIRPDHVIAAAWRPEDTPPTLLRLRDWWSTNDDHDNAHTLIEEKEQVMAWHAPNA